MDHRSSNSFTGYIVFAAALLGLLAGWLLYGSNSAGKVPPEDPTPTSGPQTTAPANVWEVPTQAVTAVQPVAPDRQIAKVGSMAPDFSLKDRSGNPTLLSDLRGKVVVINFWASWCPPCRDEMPDLQAISEEYAEEGLVVWGVNTTYVDVRKEALAFIDELELTFPIVFDETGEVGEELYSVMSLPTSYWIDREGIIRSINIGAMTKGQMAESADLLLSP